MQLHCDDKKLRDVVISIVIATKDRRDDLLGTLEKCKKLNLGNAEIIVIDDGSTDGSADMIRKYFPDIRVISHEQSAGCIVRRNEGAELASGDIIVSLDDDSYFLDEDALERIAGIFRKYPEAGAIAFDIFDSLRPVSNKPSGQKERLCRSFTGCGYAVRRSVFLELGGFRDFYVYGDEEREFCLRLMDRGYFVVKADEIRVFHAKTPNQRFIPMTHIYAFRNQICSSWLNEPLGRAIIHSTSLAMKGLVFALGHGLLRSYILAFRSLMDILPLIRSKRAPLSSRTFSLYDGLGRFEPQLDGVLLSQSHPK